jgi:hypothetical protein
VGRKWFIRSTLITSLPDDIINQTVLKFAETPVGCSASRVPPPARLYRSHTRVHFLCAAWLFELAGGAIADHTNTCIPKSQREAAFTIAALHQWEIHVDDPRCKSSAEDVGLPRARLLAWS